MSDLAITWTAIISAAAIGGFSAYLDRRPYLPGKVWYFPFRAVMLICVLAIIFATAHLITLFTGFQLPGR